MKYHKLQFQFCIFVFTGLFIVLIIHLYSIQIIRHEELKKKALEQQEDVVTLEPERGIIYDRNGNRLTVNIEVDSVYANPREISAPGKISKLLSPLLNMESREIYNKITNRARYFVWLKRKLDREESEKIKALNLKGIYFLKETKRFYPEGEFASHLIGFVSMDNKGLEGIENSYDKYLSGVPIKAVIQKDGMGKNISINKFVQEEKGNDITLTIDSVIQHIAQREIKNAYLKYKGGGTHITIIVMDPKTGELLALANEPTFNLNKFDKYKPYIWRNRAVTDMFEPGSTFKIITASAAINEEIVNLNEKFNCERGVFKFKIGREYRTIRDVHKYDTLSFLEIVRHSSNIGMTKVGMKIGEERLYQYIRAFGFGESTGIGLCGESKGLVRPLEKWSKASIAAIPYGQEISVTPIQLAIAVSAVANGGTLMKPQVVRSIKDCKGRTIFEFTPVPVRRVISMRTARKITGILEDVVKNGTGVEARIPGYRVAGKTGTAQKINPITKQYDPKKFVSSFIGYFPVEDPKVVIYVLIDEPRGEYYGGAVAAPVFKKVAEGIIAHMGILPDREKSESSLPSGANPISSQQDMLEGVMPDLRGKTIRQVLDILKKCSVKIKIQGSGIAVKQSPAPGTILKAEEEVLVEFSPHYEKTTRIN